MEQKSCKVLRWLALLLSWLTVSPLFIYLASRWKMMGKKVRISLLLVSPFMLIIYLLISVFIVLGYMDYQRKYRFADNQAIERITGVPFPELKIVNYEKGGMSFTGDYNDCLTLEMEEELSEATYHHLDSIIQNGKTDWRKRDDEYSFSLMWGNGLPAPKGEDDEEDMTFSLSMEKGSKMVVIEYGAW